MLANLEIKELYVSCPINGQVRKLSDYSVEKKRSGKHLKWPNFASQFCMRLYFTNILDGGNKRRLKMCLRVVFRSKQLFRRKKRSGKHLKCPILLEMVRQLRYLSEKFPRKNRTAKVHRLYMNRLLSMTKPKGRIKSSAT